ncbi:myomegalin [Brachionichthys hirsutus]|uniref:myomegalin n=1 Tax=Brachionichthys hirsutus TaxID=412623 RepID=UPI003604EE7A
MLKENMALSEYECWSGRWDACPYFIRTGKRCKKGKGCEGCDSLRVSDSDYESVCGIPRHLPPQFVSPLALSRDKSRSMPLDWQKCPPLSPASLVGSSLSAHASSRTVSIQSLDSLDNGDPFEMPDAPLAKFVLTELKGIGRKPVSSPSGSRIPVLSRKDRCSENGGGTTSPSVGRVLSFRDEENGVDEVDGGVLAELRDEFMALRPENGNGKVGRAVKQLRGQLDRAASRIRTLEAELKHGPSKATEVGVSEDWAAEDGDGSLLQNFGHALRSRERLIQECLGLIRRLCKQEAGTEIVTKLTENLKEMLSDNKAALESLRFEMTEKEKGMEKEMDALRKAGRDRERDLGTLNAVLQCNQDVINDLRVAAEERERPLQQVEKEREVWRQREKALGTALQEREAQILRLWEERGGQQTNKQELDGGGARQGSLEDRYGKGDALCKEISKLTTTLQEHQDMMQNQQESHSQRISSLTAELRDVRRELREKENEKREADREMQNMRNNGEREERKLKDSLEKRDKLIEQILLDAEDRDHLFKELQQNMQNIREPPTGFKHTL